MLDLGIMVEEWDAGTATIIMQRVLTYPSAARLGATRLVSSTGTTLSAYKEEDKNCIAMMKQDPDFHSKVKEELIKLSATNPVRQRH